MFILIAFATIVLLIMAIQNAIVLSASVLEVKKVDKVSGVIETAQSLADLITSLAQERLLTTFFVSTPDNEAIKPLLHLKYDETDTSFRKLVSGRLWPGYGVEPADGPFTTPENLQAFVINHRRNLLPLKANSVAASMIFYSHINDKLFAWTRSKVNEADGTASFPQLTALYLFMKAVDNSDIQRAYAATYYSTGHLAHNDWLQYLAARHLHLTYFRQAALISPEISKQYKKFENSLYYTALNDILRLPLKNVPLPGPDVQEAIKLVQLASAYTDQLIAVRISHIASLRENLADERDRATSHEYANLLLLIIAILLWPIITIGVCRIVEISHCLEAMNTFQVSLVRSVKTLGDISRQLTYENFDVNSKDDQKHIIKNEDKPAQDAHGPMAYLASGEPVTPPRRKYKAKEVPLVDAVTQKMSNF